MWKIRRLEPKDSLPDDLERLLEDAYWEMKARMDPTQTQYPTTGERYSFKQAVRNIFYKRRNGRGREQ